MSPFINVSVDLRNLSNMSKIVFWVFSLHHSQFYFLVVFCICLEVSIVIIAFVGLWYEDEFVKSYIIQGSKKEMANYGHPEREGFTAAWDRVQIDVSHISKGIIQTIVKVIFAYFGIHWRRVVSQVIVWQKETFIFPK